MRLYLSVSSIPPQLFSSIDGSVSFCGLFVRFLLLFISWYFPVNNTAQLVCVGHTGESRRSLLFDT